MMRLAATAQDGRDIVCLGLSDENVRRLPEAPILFELAEVLPHRDATVAIVYLTAAPGSNARQTELVARGLATRMLRPPSQRHHFVLALDDDTLARIDGGRCVPVLIRAERLEFVLTRGRTEKDLMEEFASLIGPETRTVIDPRTL